MSLTMATDFALIGSAFGPVGTLVGGLVGGAVGYYMGYEGATIMYNSVK